MKIEMASSTPTLTIKITETSHISPPLPSSSISSLPLTFLDIPWLLFPPSQPLFFFALPYYESFTTTVLPKLKNSLSSALQHFFPFAGFLAHRHDSSSLFFDIDDECYSVPLTVAECTDADFDHLCSYSQRNAAVFHQLVPRLDMFPTASNVSTELNDMEINQSQNQNPLLAIQITYFPKSQANNAAAFSIGLACHHVICDQRTFNHFIRSWASICKLGQLPYGLQPSYDRSVIVDPNELRPILFKQWQESKASLGRGSPVNHEDMVRATFVMGPADIVNVKRWIMAQCDECNRGYPVVLSPYVVTCSFVWACLVRAQQEVVSKGSMYFGFIAGGMTRLPFPVPVNYFGNCVGFGRVVAKREELLKGDGILVAADTIAQTIHDLNHDLLGGAENWISDWEPLIGSDIHINIVGSPKVDLYKTDFGWGTPMKIEEISIDVMRGMSLMESRDMKGGIEIGLILPKAKMEAFSSLFARGLASMDS